jgi:hypothetical protein
MRRSSQLQVNDVIYGTSGSFVKRVGKITKVNPSKPAVEDASGRRSCYWKTNMLRIGNVESRFGYCSVCNKPSEFDEPCPHSGSRGDSCQGIIQGNFDWKLVNRDPERNDLPAEDAKKSFGMLLARQLGEALFLLGIVEISEDIIAEVRAGFRSSATARRGLRIPTPSPCPTAPVSNPDVT